VSDEAEELRPHRSGRRKARKYALDVLFAADLRGLDPAALLEAGDFTTQLPPPAYSRQLVIGVAEHRATLDATIAAHLAPGWTVPRMPRVDRCLARLAVFELTATDTPAEVAVSEAVALAAELSTDNSAGFLSGVLGAIIRDPDGFGKAPETG
jgi:N utilization substance protein B